MPEPGPAARRDSVTFFLRRSSSDNVIDVPTSTATRLAPRSVRNALPEALIAPAPIVKWAGGKTRLLSQLSPLLPPGVALMRHVEPFVGGGAMFFARQPTRALLCDINPMLIATYEAVRDETEAVIEQLEQLSREHDGRAYYRVRERYNRARKIAQTERAAMFIYLNKTCFNGLHRVNQKGEFNVPMGRYSQPRIVHPEALRAAARQLRHATLRCAGFESLLSAARPGDFIYFDPPYEPMSDTASFTAYAQSGFGREEQLRLRDVFAALDQRGCKLMLSNSDVPFIRELYRKYQLDGVSAARAINSNAKKRGPVQEIVVRNYG
jgi:DNA adenine methylase